MKDKINAPSNSEQSKGADNQEQNKVTPIAISIGIKLEHNFFEKRMLEKLLYVIFLLLLFIGLPHYKKY